MTGRFSRRRLLVGAAGTALTLGAVSAAAEGSATAATSSLRFLRHAYDGDPAARGTERWQHQVLQGDRPRPSATLVAEQLVYATAVRRWSDPDGVTQCLRPADVPRSWLLTDDAGATITRNGGDDAAIDVGNAEFQEASADFLVAKCRAGTAGQPWSGVQHDEVNASFGWGWEGASPARYPSDASWQDALSSYLAHLARRLDDAGFDLGANLGAATSDDVDGWYGSLVGSGVVPSLEFFVCGELAADGSTENYASPAEWERQVRYVELAERNRSGSPDPVTRAGTRIAVHDRQDQEPGIRYSLASYLLASDGSGASVYGADVDYDASTTPYPDCYADALRLGPPTSPRIRVAGDLWGRRFTHGWVLVNTGTSVASCYGITLGPRSARIGVTT